MSADPWVDWGPDHPYFADSDSEESRPDDDPPPVIVCDGKQCGGYPHG